MERLAYSCLNMVHGTPTLLQIREAAARLNRWIAPTPTVSWDGLELQRRVGRQTQVFVKLELLQRAGSFATAALAGPLGQRLRGLRVGITLCGTNIDLTSFTRHLA